MIKHNYVPPGQPVEWPIPMTDEVWASADPTAVHPNTKYTTNSQNRGGKA